MMESDVELNYRISCFQFDDNVRGVDADIISRLTNMLNEYNEIVRVFRTAREMHIQFTELPVRIRLFANRGSRDQNYSVLTTPEIVALIIGDIGISDYGRNIIVEHRHERLKRISDLHQLFVVLQYLLLFPYGENYFHLNIPYEESPVREN